METMYLRLFMMMCLGVCSSSSEMLNRQKRNWIIDSFSIDEGYKGTFPYLLGRIQVEKDLTLFKIHGQGVDEEPKGVLKIDEYTGELTVHRPVDYEEFKVLKVIFQALDREKHEIDTQLGVEVSIIDANDNPPKFDLELYENTIKESTLQGSELITIKASDVDSNSNSDTNKNNGIFDFRIVSVTPEPKDLEFYLISIAGSQIGTISFKGCLDHETEEKYTIIVEAKDRGEVQLSSSCTIVINIEDGNNHFPVITGQTGPGTVKEGEENVTVSRLQVTDKDTKGTRAWRAKFHIQGDTNNNFRMTTDPETNEGLLYVEKHLNYEDGPVRNITIILENEVSYHSCEVVRRTTTGLWQIKTTGGETGQHSLGQSTYQVRVVVEDVNEPPIFDTPIKKATLSENVKAGQYLETFKARDPDITSANTFVYRIGEDPAGWVTVDAMTGKITTSKIIDRESPFVKNNIYNVTIYAIDSGKPPATGTATLNIQITDENDNTPTLTLTTIDMCQSDKPSLAEITAVDLDDEPYGGPFQFKLLGDVEGKWRVDPHQGYSVNLVKEKKVHSGEFQLKLEVSDLQHSTAVHNLSVTVCDCLNPARPNCRARRATGSGAGGGVLGIIFLSLLLFAGVLLLAFLMSCKTVAKPFPLDDGLGHLKHYNSETPGTDCKVVFEPINQEGSQDEKNVQIKTGSIAKIQAPAPAYSAHTKPPKNKWNKDYEQWLISEDSVSKKSWGNSMYWSVGASSAMRKKYEEANLSLMRHSKYASKRELEVHRKILFKVLNTMLHNVQTSEKELSDDILHVYADEEDSVTSFELDAISIPDVSFDPDLDLDLRFSSLASICMPCQSTAYSTKTSCVMGKLETETLFQEWEEKKTNMTTLSHF